MRFRHVHVDFHTSPAIKNVGGAFDTRSFLSALDLGHVDSVTVFAKCHHGYSYHPSKANETHPGLSFDLLGAQLEACRGAGVRAPVYISAGLDEKYAVAHPEHLVRSSPDQIIGFDQPGYHLLCVNTPYLDILIEQVLTAYHPTEIFLDICSIRSCRCAYCLDSMKRKGYDPDDPDDVYRHGREVYFNYTKRVAQAVSECSPDTEIFHNAGQIPFGDREFASYDSHLELESICEGVENHQQLKQVRELGCDVIQGYVISRSVNAEKARDMIVNYHYQPPVEEPAVENVPKSGKSGGSK